MSVTNPTKTKRRAARPAFTLANEQVEPGQRRLLYLPAPRQLGHEQTTLPVHVLHGRGEGPVLLVSAGIHGDELNGIEVIRRLLARKALMELRGTLLAVPVVNVYGFVGRSRYLPDRRDLNRSFPGKEAGSLAARLAHLVESELVARVTHAVDLHTGAVHRTNLPHLRADLDDPRALELAHAFQAPLVLGIPSPAGTLSQSARARGIPMLVFEGGEALRFDETAIRVGLRGVLAVMRRLGMLPRARNPRAMLEPIFSRHRKWIRAPRGGLLSTKLEPGTLVSTGGILARIADPYTGELCEVRSPMDGVVVGLQLLPLVNEGDAIVHLAHVGDEDSARALMDLFEDFDELPYDERSGATGS